MRPTWFAITDIETTGGSPAEGAITEVAILIHDGLQVVDRFETLINPGREIPHFITVLTGIHNKMVQDAPFFEEVAQQIFSLLEGKIFVAHNVNFDHSFLHHRFKQVGLHFQPQKLCSVRYARKVMPGLPSYSLGNLCRQLSIPITYRHRAMGDAEATCRLFEKLLAADVDKKNLIAMTKSHKAESYLPMNVPVEMIEQLPYCPGVYYFIDQYDKIVYVGKAVNLKHRVKSHFTHNSPGKRRQDMIRRIYKIAYKTCATEMMATIYESLEIKRLWPAFNRSQKKYESVVGVYPVTDRANRLKLVVAPKKNNLPCLYTCSLAAEATQLVNKLANDIEVPTEYVWGYYNTTHESPELINQKVNKVIEQIRHFLPDFVLVENGQDVKGDVCYVSYCIEKGAFTGMAISEKKPKNWQEVKAILQQVQENSFVRNLLLTSRLQNKGTFIFPDVAT